MDELIKTITQDDGTVAVSGRDLHDFLGVAERYTQWFERMVSYGFTKGIDFVGFSEKAEKPTGGRPRIDYVMTLDMAKEVAMLQRTDRGKQARRYFISIEKQYKQSQLDMTGLSPQTQAAIATAQALATQERSIKRLDTKVDAIADIVSTTTIDWRNKTNHLINAIVRRQGNTPEAHRSVRKAIYDEVEQRGSYSLARRLTNKLQRMAMEGASKYQRSKITKVDVIADDARLQQVYMAVVKDHAIRFRVWDDEY